MTRASASRGRSGLRSSLTRRTSLRLLAGLGLAHGWGRQVALAVGPGQPRGLQVVVGADSASARQILAALRLRFPALVADDDPGAFEARSAPVPVVAIGPVALRLALEADLKGPLVSVLTSSQTYRQLTQEACPSVTAIHADASPLAQVQLISALFENRGAVGVLLSDSSAYLERPLRQAAAQFGLELLLERVAPSMDVVRSLTRLRGAQVLLAVPDTTLYTAGTLRAILESTYRRGMPVIGFSSATVAAGTLATAYCAVDDVVADLLELLEVMVGQVGTTVPEPRFARYWRVAVNESVARSLGVPVTDKVRQLGHPASGRSA